MLVIDHRVITYSTHLKIQMVTSNTLSMMVRQALDLDPCFRQAP